jgi:DMSO/TMAO reductase YedYZ heme-binding membrane subunit
MSAGYRAVQWNRKKLVYDAIALSAIALYVGAFLIIGAYLDPPKNAAAAADLRIRAFGSCAFVMLTIILAIGPLARLDPRFLVLLYNRRHLGVMTFCVVSLHFYSMIQWYLALNALPNFGNELTSWGDYAHFIGFPFKTLGIVAWFALFLLAATSHDFWLYFLSPRTWKALHMALYGAYGLVVIHVALGAMQSERSVIIPLMLFGGFGIVATLHIAAGWREHALDRGTRPRSDGWIADRSSRSPIRRRASSRRPEASGSRCSATAGASARSPICARTRTDRSARAASSTAASPARGTATNIGSTTAARRRPTSRSSKPTRSGCVTALSRSIRIRCRPARRRRSPQRTRHEWARRLDRYRGGGGAFRDGAGLH